MKTTVPTDWQLLMPASTRSATCGPCYRHARSLPCAGWWHCPHKDRGFEPCSREVAADPALTAWPRFSTVRFLAMPKLVLARSLGPSSALVPAATDRMGGRVAGDELVMPHVAGAMPARPTPGGSNECRRLGSPTAQASQPGTAGTAPQQEGGGARPEPRAAVHAATAGVHSRAGTLMGDWLLPPHCQLHALSCSMARRGEVRVSWVGGSKARHEGTRRLACEHKRERARWVVHRHRQTWPRCHVTHVAAWALQLLQI